MAVDTFLAYVGVYDDAAGADADYQAVKDLHTKAGLIDAYDAAVIERRADGKVKITKKHETPTRRFSRKPLHPAGNVVRTSTRKPRGCLDRRSATTPASGRPTPGVSPILVRAHQVPIARTLALLTRSRGALRGANDRRHRALPGHVQPLSLQPKGTSGDTQHYQATLRKCLLSSRSRVRVAVGAQMMQVILHIRNYNRSIDVLLASNHSI